jgi:hypothetical protein
MFLNGKARCSRVTDNKAEMLRDQAERCRRLARETKNRLVAQKLLELANEFEDHATTEEARKPCRSS